jgi:GntR family transcriptional regulator
LNKPSFQIQLDFRSNLPIYLQIVNRIEQLIAAGVLHRGDQLPTVRELATELRVNFNTVSRAYSILDEAGLISTQRGRGTYIWEEPNTQTVVLLRRKGLDALTRRYLQEASRLGFALPDVVQCLHERLQSGREKASLPAKEPND